MPLTAYDPYKDLIPVTRIATAPLLLLTHPGSGLASVKDVIAKAKAEPGKLAFGSRAMAPSTSLRSSGSRLKPASNFCTCPIAAARRW